MKRNQQILGEVSPGTARQSEQAELRLRIQRVAFSMSETAEALGVSYITVHRLLKRGLLKSSSALRHKLIPRSEIERFLNATLE